MDINSTGGGADKRRLSKDMIQSLVRRHRSIAGTRADKKHLSFNNLSTTHEDPKRKQGSFFDVLNLVHDSKNDKIPSFSRQASTFDAAQRFSKKGPTKSKDKDKEKELYKVFVYTVMYRMGKKQHCGDTVTDGELYAYGREVFNIDDVTHREIINEMKQLKPPDFFVHVEVIAGSGLDPKDANGLSDPYCMLCLVNSNEVEDGSRKKKPLRELRKSNDVSVTKVMRKTLDPVWNQSYKFDVKDVQNEFLRIDVWDKDDNSAILDDDNTIGSVKGLKGASRMFKEIYQSATINSNEIKDDFMGLTEIPLKTVTEHGLDTWFELESTNPKKRVHGKLHIKIKLTSKNTDNRLAQVSQIPPCEIYEEMLTSFASKDWETSTNQCQDNNFNTTPVWNCRPSPAADTTLMQYAIQNDISKLSISVIRWQVFSKFYTHSPIPLNVLIEILEVYKDNSNNNTGQNSEEDSDQFFDSLDAFVEHSFQLIEKYRYTFNYLNPEECVELGKLLLCLITIYKLPIYKGRRPGKSLKNEVETLITKSTKNWFYQIEASLETLENSQTPSNKLEKMVNVITEINLDLQSSQKSYEPVFNVINVKYISFVFNGVELLVAEMINEGTKGLKEVLNQSIADEIHEDGLLAKMFQLYLGVRDLCKMKTTLPAEDRIKGGISDSRSWFKQGVIKWIDLAGAKAQSRINTAIELDEVRVIDDMVKHSTSAVDVTCCLGQICSFWKALEWPDPDESYMFLTKINEIIGNAAMYYADIVVNQLKQKGFYDDVGQFDVTDQLCIMMNDVSHVIEFFNQLPTSLQYDKVVSALAEQHGQERAEHYRKTFEDIQRMAIDGMENKLEEILKHVGKRMQESLKPYISKVLRDDGNSFENASEPLLAYLDSNLLTLRSGLLSQVFDRVLSHFWEDLIIAMLEIIESKGKALTVNNYTSLGNLISVMKEFFHADKCGIPLDDMRTKDFLKLEATLGVYTSSTKQLIETFYCHQVEAQKEASATMGTMTFKIFYCNTAEKLNIQILNCRDLVPMDVSGSSDPYITLKLKPDHLFPGIKRLKSKVVKNTLFPLFDESFQFDISAADCQKEGATLLFTLFDHDMLDDDICGEAHLDLQLVLGLTGLVQAGFTNIPQTELPFFISRLGGSCFRALEDRRKHDQMASLFVGQLHERFKGMSENNQQSNARQKERKR